MKFKTSGCFDCPLRVRGEELDWDGCGHPELGDRDWVLNQLALFVEKDFLPPDFCPLKKGELVIALDQQKNEPCC